MKIPKSILPELHWWLDHLPSSTNKIKQFSFVREIFTDSSTTGWGASCESENVNGFWNEVDRSEHINYLEILAAFWGLKSFAEDLSKCEILLRIDNTTAVSYINRMGGIQFPHLNSLSQKIWDWCEKRNIWIFASYIHSKENVDADTQSRLKNLDTEWELSNFAYKKIVNTFSKPNIDLFATDLNTKCRNFCSFENSQFAVAIDAFTISWSEKFFYAFPPFSMILRTLKKIKVDKAQGIVVVPFWTSQPWFPMFRSLLISEPLIFKPHLNLLMSSCRTRSHPMAQTLSLAAGILSGKVIQENKCPKTQ